MIPERSFLQNQACRTGAAGRIPGGDSSSRVRLGLLSGKLCPALVLTFCCPSSEPSPADRGYALPLHTLLPKDRSTVSTQGRVLDSYIASPCLLKNTSCSPDPQRLALFSFQSNTFTNVRPDSIFVLSSNFYLLVFLSRAF